MEIFASKTMANLKQKKKKKKFNKFLKIFLYFYAVRFIQKH